MRKLIQFVTLMLIITAQPAYAGWKTITSLLSNVVQQQAGINTNTAQMNNKMDAMTRSMDRVRDMTSEGNNKLGSILGGLTGQHHYASDFEFSNWGNDATNWESVLALADNHSNSELGQEISRLSHDFPIEHLNSNNDIENQYYRLQAQTTLASRAAAELSYRQASQSAAKMQQLKNQIDSTPDAKSAADLNNRLALENANISVQQTKLLAILVEQNALESQQKANAALYNAKFFK